MFYWNNRNFFEIYEKFKLNADLKDLEKLSRVRVILNLNKDLAICTCILKTRDTSNISNTKNIYYDLILLIKLKYTRAILNYSNSFTYDATSHLLLSRFINIVADARPKHW